MPSPEKKHSVRIYALEPHTHAHRVLCAWNLPFQIQNKEWKYALKNCQESTDIYRGEQSNVNRVRNFFGADSEVMR